MALQQWFAIALLSTFTACGLAGSGTGVDVSKLCASGPSMPPAPTALVTAKKMRDLALAPNALVYVDKDSGQGSGAGARSGTIHRVALDGTGDIQLYEPDSSSKSLWDVTVVGQTVYFLEQELLLTATMRLMKISLDGGAATGTELPALYTGFLGTGFVGSESALYMRVANDGNPNGGVGRFNLADNTTTTILAPSILENLFLGTDAIFYLTRPSLGDAAETRTLDKATKTENASGAAIGSAHCRGSFFVTAENIFCGGYSATGAADGKPSSANLTKLDLAGGAPRDWLSLKDAFSGSSTHIGAVLGDEAIVSLTGTGKAYPLLAVTLANGTARALACEQMPVDLDYGTRRPMLVGSSSAVYWIAEGDRGTGPNTLFKANLR